MELNVIGQIIPKIGPLFKKIIALISVLSMIVSVVGGLSPTPEERDLVKNVIFIIGDGMGENHLEMTKADLGIDLVMETMPLRGQSKTNALGGVVTDSAAGGTALACGIRTIVGTVGVYSYDLFGWYEVPTNLTEIAIEKGMKTGVITTDSTGGATPASFSAHTSARSNQNDIAAQQIASDIDLIWGAANGITTPEEAEAAGFTYINNATQMNALQSDSRSFAQFDSNELWKSNPANDTPTLTQMSVKAFELLDNDNGFFIMIEGAHIDKFSHSNKREETVACVRELDNTVAAALEFAENDGETLVVVTADHETGAIAYKDGRYEYTSGSHSTANVPLLVYGSTNFIENGKAVKNKHVAIYTAMSMGVPAGEFPRKNPTNYAA